MQNGNLRWFYFIVRLVTQHRATLHGIHYNDDQSPLRRLLGHPDEVLQFFVDHCPYDSDAWSSLPSTVQRPTSPIIDVLAARR